MIVNTFYNPATGMSRVLWLRNAANVKAEGAEAVKEALTNHPAYAGRVRLPVVVKWLRERARHHNEWEVPTPLNLAPTPHVEPVPVATDVYPVHLVPGHVLTDDDVSWILATWQKQYRA